MLTLFSLARSVLERADSDFQGIIEELYEKNGRKVGKVLPLLWAIYCRFLAKDYIIWLFVGGFKGLKKENFTSELGRILRKHSLRNSLRETSKAQNRVRQNLPA